MTCINTHLLIKINLKMKILKQTLLLLCLFILNCLAKAKLSNMVRLTKKPADEYEKACKQYLMKGSTSEYRGYNLNKTQSNKFLCSYDSTKGKMYVITTKKSEGTYDYLKTPTKPVEYL